MRGVRPVVALVIALGFASVGVAGSPFGGGAFSCSDAAQCGPRGVGGPNALCSFPDVDCLSGRRYGQASGDLANVCVGEEPPDAGVTADGRPDSPPGTPDGAIDATPPAPFCDPTDATQRLCLDFQGDAVDGSGTNTVVQTTSINFAAGQVRQAV